MTAETTAAEALTNAAYCDREVSTSTQAVQDTERIIKGLHATLTRATRNLNRCRTTAAKIRNGEKTDTATDAITRAETRLAAEHKDLAHWTAEAARLRQYAADRTTPEDTTMPDQPAEPTTTLNLPGAFCDWLNGTRLALGQDDTDPECLATRTAYQDAPRRTAGRAYYRTITATPTVLRILAEYADYCLDANSDDGTPAQAAAARKVTQRTQAARTALREQKAAPAAEPEKLADWERELLPADTHPTTPRYTTADQNIAEGDDPQEPQERTGVTRGFTITDGLTDRTPVLDIDAGHRYQLVALRPAGVTEEPGQVLAYNVHTGLPNLLDRYQVGTLNGERVAWGVDGHTWEDFKGYQVRTEGRGNGIIAVYVKGPANDTKGIERASRAYARTLTFAAGMSRAAISGGGESRDAGATYISQDMYMTRPLTAPAH